MAKKKDETAEDAETNKSIGSQMKSKLTQRERNLKVKAEMIERGERDEPTAPPSQTVHARNLALKKELQESEDFIKKEAEKLQDDENEKDEKTGKGKSKKG